jgi:transposase
MKTSTSFPNSTPDPSDGIRFRRLKRNRPLRVTPDELLSADHPVRLIDEFVESLNFTALYGGIKAREGRPGAPVFDPRMLFALWLYATIEGISSARELAHRCKRDLPYQWLSGQTRPNYHTLADFYSDNEAFLQSAFAEHLEVLLDHDLITLKEVTLDGRKIPANASKESFHREPTLTRHRQEVEEHLAKLAAQRAAGYRDTKRREAAQERALTEKKERLEAAVAVVKRRREEQSANRRRPHGLPEEVRASETDADARKMKMPDGGYTPAYNTQTVTDTQYGLIVSVQVTDKASDNGLLSPMMEDVQSVTGQLPERVLLDSGFANQEQIEHWEKAGVTIYMPPKNERQELNKGTDPYARKRRDTDGTAACRTRMGTPEAKTIYRRRAPVAEGVHAQQSNRGWQRYRLRGLVKAGVEALWQALAHNLTVLIARNRLPRFALCYADN